MPFTVYAFPFVLTQIFSLANKRATSIDLENYISWTSESIAPRPVGVLFLNIGYAF